MLQNVEPKYFLHLSYLLLMLEVYLFFPIFILAFFSRFKTFFSVLAKVTPVG